MNEYADEPSKKRESKVSPETSFRVENHLWKGLVGEIVFCGRGVRGI